MTARVRTGALTAGLILIAIGVIFLIGNWYPISAWHLAATYWPVILILIGLRKLVDYFTWQEIPPLPEQQVKE
jgi:hypothetical protein